MGTAPAALAAPKPPKPKPTLSLLAATSAVTLDKYKGNGDLVGLDLGIHVGAPDAPFEVRVHRKSYRDPIVAEQIVRQGGKSHTKRLPKGLVKDFSGFSKFLHVTITDAAGKKVADLYQGVCPSNEQARIRPGAPSTSPYPTSCSDNPWTRGSVWGIQRGWASKASGWSAPQAKLADGKYTATVSVTAPYQKAFGLPAAAKKIAVTVRTVDDGSGHPMSGKAAVLKAGPKPTGNGSVPKGPKPDLAALPAWGIQLNHGEDDMPPGPRPGNPPAPGPKRDYLAFSATVWNAGPSPLVVDGFRAKPGLMDAYQYFFDGHGKQVGYAKTGGMEWDPREGHQHWHFKDFASYRLLGKDKKEIVRSQKEAFCLANTDAINQLVKNANWHPDNTDLHTACGDITSLSVREVLDVGSGDTYAQFRPGQSFDVTDLKNGTYFIQVIANPSRRLFEGTAKNNMSLRKVTLGGTPGHRTVKVAPVGLVNAP